MEDKVIRHRLYEIDMENRTAFCTVCGYTEVHVTRTRTRTMPKIYCVKRMDQILEKRRAKNQRLRLAREPRSEKKPRHSLTGIDPENGTAICAVCGPTDIRKHRKKSTIYYACANKERELGREYHRLHYVSKSTNPQIHALSEVDEARKTALCSRCGPVAIEIWRTKKKINRRCCNVPRRKKKGNPVNEIV